MELNLRTHGACGRTRSLLCGCSTVATIVTTVVFTTQDGISNRVWWRTGDYLSQMRPAAFPVLRVRMWWSITVISGVVKKHCSIHVWISSCSYLPSALIVCEPIVLSGCTVCNVKRVDYWMVSLVDNVIGTALGPPTKFILSGPKPWSSSWKHQRG